MRFSLKAFLACVSAVCVLLGGWVLDARRQAAAIRGVEAAGGHVYYDETPWFSEAIDQRLVALLGKDMIYRVATACPNEATLEEALPHLVQLRGLKRVHFWVIVDQETRPKISGAIPLAEVTSRMGRVY